MTARRNPDVLIDAFLTEGATDLPDRTFDAVRSDIHRTRQRVVFGPWREPNMLTPIRMGLAAAIVVIAAEIAWSQIAPRLPSSGGPPTPLPTTSPAPSATQAVPATALLASTEPLARGRYAIDYGSVPGSDGAGPSIEFDVASLGWYAIDASSVEFIYPDGVSYGPAFGVWNITASAGNPCAAYEPATPAPGPSIDDLLNSLADQPGIEAGPIVPVTIGGYTGAYVELTVAADIGTCPDGFFTWGSETEGRAAKATGEVDRVYAIDVDAQRITFYTRVPSDTGSEQEGQLRRIVESIDIQP